MPLRVTQPGEVMSADELLGHLRRYIKAACGGSQAAAARAMSISPQLLSDVLAGRREITDRIATLFGVRRYIVYGRYVGSRAAARQAVQRAITTGRLVRPVVCGRCGAGEVGIEAHHPDYRIALQVEWLCPRCHAAADKERRANKPLDTVRESA